MAFASHARGPGTVPGGGSFLLIEGKLNAACLLSLAMQSCLSMDLSTKYILHDNSYEKKYRNNGFSDNSKLEM